MFLSPRRPVDRQGLVKPPQGLAVLAPSGKDVCQVSVSACGFRMELSDYLPKPRQQLLE
jgi:hypothetical protein